jgi:DNA invertase Pin-like site-specific DNA recombinase
VEASHNNAIEHSPQLRAHFCTLYVGRAWRAGHERMAAAKAGMCERQRASDITLTTVNVKYEVGNEARLAPGSRNTVVVYLRVSTSEQALSCLGIEAQRATAASYAERKGLTIVDAYCDEGISAKSLTGRHGAQAALSAVRPGKASGLLVAKMDRLSRSVVDGAGLMEAARPEGWALHFADLDIDTGTPTGEMAANIVISGSQYERRLISQRTRDALAAKRARGERLGAAPRLPLEITRRIIAERAGGRTFQAIADRLMADGIPTARDKTRWFRRRLRQW